MDTPLSDEAGMTAFPAVAPCTAVIITNPASGSFLHQHNHQATLAYLQEQGWQVETWPTHGPGDAQALAHQAVEQHIAVVIVAGGDGTINEVIQALAGSETALGVLPTGTVNVWAREMSIPLDDRKAREALAHGQTRYVDLGRVNDRYFLLMAGVGLDAQVTQIVERRPLKRLGVLGYALAALWFGPGYRGFSLTLRLDDAQPMRMRALQIIAGNTRLYGGAFKFTWLARCDDGLLDLCVVRQRSLWARLLLIRDFLLKKDRRRLRVSYSTFTKAVIETAEPVAIQIDGDPLGYTPATFTIVPGALKVLVPENAPLEVFSSQALAN